MARFKNKDLHILQGEEVLFGDTQEASITYDGSDLILDTLPLYVDSYLATREYVTDTVEKALTGLEWQDSVLSITSNIPVSGNEGDRYIAVVPSGVAWDPDNKDSTITLSNGNLTATKVGTGGWRSVIANINRTSGKWYWEITIDVYPASAFMLGVAHVDMVTTLYVGQGTDGVGYYDINGNTFLNAVTTAYGDSYNAGDVIGIALDCDNDKIFFSKNDVWQDSGDPVAGTNPAQTIDGADGWSPAFSMMTDLAEATANFGNTAFAGTLPTGYTAISDTGVTWFSDDIVEWETSTWSILTPSAGFATWVDDEGVYYVFNGTDWIKLGGVVSHSALLNLDVDDHTQYLLADGTRTASYLTVTGTVTAAEFHVNQGTDDDEAILFRSDDVAHGITTVAETDIYGHLAKADADAGGVGLWGFSESTIGSSLYSYYGDATGDSDKDTTAIGAFTLYALQADGTGVKDVETDDNILVLRPRRSGALASSLIADGSGNLYVDGDYRSFGETLSVLTSADYGMTINADGTITFTGAISASGYTGVDHNLLLSLIDPADDHTQYLHIDGRRPWTGTLTISAAGSSIEFLENSANIGVFDNTDLMTLSPTAVTVDGDIFCNTLHSASASVIIGGITMSDVGGDLVVDAVIISPSGAGGSDFATIEYVDTKSPIGHDHDTEYYTQTIADLTFSPITSGVTGGDSHDHTAGAGAQIDHAGLANKGTNTHAQIDTHVGLVSEHIDWTNASDNLLTTGSISAPAFYLDSTPDSDETASGTTTTMNVTGNTVGFGSALYMTSGGDGLDEADADWYSTMPCRVLALETGTGQDKSVLLKGFIRDDSWSWVPGLSVYVSTTVGTLTQTPPAGSGDQVQTVGWAHRSNVLYFDPDKTVVEIA